MGSGTRLLVVFYHLARALHAHSARCSFTHSTRRMYIDCLPMFFASLLLDLQVQAPQESASACLRSRYAFVLGMSM